MGNNNICHNRRNRWGEGIKRICAICGGRRSAKARIKPPISPHNEVGKQSDLSCTYCPEIFREIQTLSRHLYINKICRKIKQKIQENDINWKQV